MASFVPRPAHPWILVQDWSRTNKAPQCPTLALSYSIYIGRGGKSSAMIVYGGVVPKFRIVCPERQSLSVWSANLAYRFSDSCKVDGSDTNPQASDHDGHRHQSRRNDRSMRITHWHHTSCPIKSASLLPK